MPDDALDSLFTPPPAVPKMPPDFVGDIKAFHEKFGLTYDGKPRVLPADMAEFRAKFMKEELDEWRAEQEKFEEFLTDNESYLGSREARLDHAAQDVLKMQLDAMVDLMYVQLGTVYLQGMGPMLEEAWRRVHAANMAKIRVEKAEDSKRGSTYDVVKPAGWAPPDHSDLVADHAHR